MIDKILLVKRGRGLSSLYGALYYGLKGAMSKMSGRRYLRKRIYNYEMWLDLNDRGISRTLLLFGERELEHKIMLEKVLKPGMTVFDIGANIGYYLIMAHKIMKGQGHFVAVEPSPANIDLLRRNLELNGCKDVMVLSMAISEERSIRRFHLAEQSNLNTFHDVGTGLKHLSGKSIDVETDSVPGLASRVGRIPDLIRMDVEGHEVEVLNGLIDAVSAGEMAPMIIFETHLSRYSPEHDMEKTLRRLFGLGYRVTLVGSSAQRGSSILEDRGYKGAPAIRTDDVERKIFENISDEDAVELICREGGIRTVLLQKSR